MAPKRIRPEQIADLIPPESRVWLHACSGESRATREGLLAGGRRLEGLTFTGIFVPGLNDLGPLAAEGARFETFFMTPELAKAGDQVEFLPLCYREIRLRFAANPPQAALVTLAPPDEAGLCSFGPVNDFLADIWEQVPLLIAHINPRLPRTQGRAIPFERLSAVFEAEEALPESASGSDAVSEAIAAHARAFIPDGATIQAGLGRAPEAVLRGLTGRRDLAIHSGLIGDSTLDLLEAGALRAESPITAGVAIGGRRLYEACGRAEFRFGPPSEIHDLRVLAGLRNFVTVNSALEVDLSGAAYAEATPKGFVSGPGGASDFAAGARGLDGLRLVVLPATAAGGKIGRIVPEGRAAGPVSLGRFDLDVIVTEHGAADLRGLSAAERRRRLIAIAAPEHRAALKNPGGSS